MTILNRPRRMRESSFSRTLMRENNVSISNLIYPMFIIEGTGIRQDIESMPGIQRLSIDELIKDASECDQLGIPAIAIFPYIEKKLKTDDASEAFNDDGLVQRAIKRLKKEIPRLGIISDVALDPFTLHGQDGVTDKKATY